MIYALSLLAAFCAGLLLGAYRSAPHGHETEDGFVLDREDAI